jgi:hypothetical protein
LAWLGLAWLGLAWLGLAWLGLAWLGLALIGLALLGSAWFGLSAWLGLARPHVPGDKGGPIFFILTFFFGALFMHKLVYYNLYHVSDFMQN